MSVLKGAGLKESRGLTSLCTARCLCGTRLPAAELADGTLPMLVVGVRPQ